LVILQDPSSSNTVNFTGQGAVTLTGVVYVPDALVQIVGQGNVTINPGAGTAVSPPPILGALIAYDLKVDGNGVLTINPDDPSGMMMSARRAGSPQGGVAEIGRNGVFADSVQLRQVSLILGSVQSSTKGGWLLPSSTPLVTNPTTTAGSFSGMQPIGTSGTTLTALPASNAGGHADDFWISLGIDSLNERIANDLVAN
jgi:hypothetical protein